jgi:hypothetical protein
MSKLNTFLLAAVTAISVGSLVLSSTGSAFAHDGGSGHENFGRGSDHQGSDRSQSQNQNKNRDQNEAQNLQTKPTILDKTGNNHSILQGLKQWQMKEERTRTLGEIVRLVQGLNQRVKLGQVTYQQLQAILAQGAKLQAKFLANGGTQEELNAAVQKVGGIAA